MKIIAKKSLGQNFLKENSVLQKIITASSISSDDYILEIGPGLGALTKAIANENPAKIAVVEKDHRFIKVLQEIPNVNVIHGDALNFDIKTITNTDKKVKIIANLPYNIGTKLLTNWIESNINCIDSMTLMLQKEVVSRIIAKPRSKDYGRLSVLSQIFCDARKVCDVPPSAFVPAPRVMSSVVFLKPHHKYDINPKDISRITSQIFGSRRKIIKNLLQPCPEEFASKRAEELSIEEIFRLIKEI